ncbi:uncharacterized protein [Palaemon carinicauda]|uniref:uncharacterized protein n=1 Tax=Palaemon carinicauda TaxID=392227 RepID=UPI0035B67EE2
MNQKCKVCGEPAAGFHFGAFTCEGCKSFFGRTYKNLTSINECKNNGQCTINKKTRTSCKSCRLRRCLMVGMSKSGSRYGRRSNWFKMHYLMQNNNNNSDDDKNYNTPSSSSDENPIGPTFVSNEKKHITPNSESLKPSLTIKSNQTSSESSKSQHMQNKRNLWLYVMPSEYQDINIIKAFLDNNSNTTLQENTKLPSNNSREPFLQNNIASTTINSQRILPQSLYNPTPTSLPVQELQSPDISCQLDKTPLLSVMEQRQIKDYIKPPHDVFSASFPSLLRPPQTVHPYLYQHYSSLLSLYSQHQYFRELLWKVKSEKKFQKNPNDDKKDQESSAPMDYQPPSKVFKTNTESRITSPHPTASNTSVLNPEANSASTTHISCEPGVNDTTQHSVCLQTKIHDSNISQPGCHTQDHPIDLSFRVNAATSQQEIT